MSIPLNVIEPCFNPQLDGHVVVFANAEFTTLQPALAVGISSCSNALQSFYNRSKELSELDSVDWQETEMDATLCKAGLW